MKRTILSFSALLLAFAQFASSASAMLDWETTMVTQQANPLDEKVDATFKFKNIGSESVEISEVKPSCGCTTTDLAKKVYQPGETGEIKATFNIGSRQGLQTKTIRVSTSEGEEPTVLTMKTMIPNVVSIKPGFVFWKTGEVPEPKSVKLDIGLDEPVHIVSASSNNSNMEAVLVPEVDGKSYELQIFPLSTDEALKATIILKTDYPQENPKTFYVHAHVKEG